MTIKSDSTVNVVLTEAAVQFKEFSEAAEEEIEKEAFAAYYIY